MYFNIQFYMCSRALYLHLYQRQRSLQLVVTSHNSSPHVGYAHHTWPNPIQMMQFVGNAYLE